MSTINNTAAENFDEPSLVLNDPGKGKKVLTELIGQLKKCEAFRFYVAFVTQSGIQSLKQQLAELRDGNIKGKILVSTYLNFTCPTALKALKEFDNLEVRIANSGNVHAKGYYFNSASEWQFIIGSSNWTGNALSSNTELNILVHTDNSHTLTKELINEFDIQFKKSEPLTDDFINEYNLQYEEAKISLGTSNTKLLKTEKLRPNKMQLDAMGELTKLREQGHQKALIISATGTGKTFLSAFDAKAFNSKRLLFVVHRENIARKALNSFKRVFGNSRSYGIYSGNKKEENSDFVFSTVQTLSRTDRLRTFDKDHFDYIIVDESHRAAASSYEVFLDYFRPKFLLGMTATPERTDGKDIFEKFDHNVGYEIRLQQALEEDILCPFHYFGVADIEVDNELLTDHADFNKLTSQERVSRIIEKAQFYGCQNNDIRGLVFCSRIEEAKELSTLFNKHGYRTVALSGKTEESERELCIQRLESNDASVKLDYIFTVDIFNEGVDIPSVNQIIMLRPTQSAIIFVQQLGRGLRKLEDSEKFLTVIDFIGNYQNNYLIPIALFGDKSFDKDQIRRLMVDESECIPGSSTVSFDRIAKERIFNSINTANTSATRDLKLDYLSLKHRLGKSPMMMDFWKHGARDPKAFIDNKKSYYNFKVHFDPDSAKTIGEDHKLLLEFYSVHVLNAVRAEESIILEQLMVRPRTSLKELQGAYEIEIGLPTNSDQISHAINCLNLGFLRATGTNNRNNIEGLIRKGLLNLQGENVSFTENFNKLLELEVFSSYLKDLIEYSKNKFKRDLKLENIEGGFVKNRKYSRSDVLRLLCWKKDQPPLNVGGYVISQENRTCPIFVTYHKDEEISESIKYGDAFVNRFKMKWYTKSKRTINSPDVKFFRESTDSFFIPLFVKKGNDEGTDFYFIARVRPETNSFKEELMPSKEGAESGPPVVSMILNLDQPVDEGLYNYLHEKTPE